MEHNNIENICKNLSDLSLEDNNINNIVTCLRERFSNMNLSENNEIVNEIKEFLVNLFNQQRCYIPLKIETLHYIM